MSKTMSLLAVLLLALTAQAAADAAPKPGTPKMPAVPKLQIKASPAPAAAPSKAAPAPAKPVTPAQPSGNPPRLVPEAAPAGVWRYTLRVTAGVVAPDCGGTRKALLINNMFQPTMEVASGDTLEVRRGERAQVRRPDRRSPGADYGGMTLRQIASGGTSGGPSTMHAVATAWGPACCVPLMRNAHAGPCTPPHAKRPRRTSHASRPCTPATHHPSMQCLSRPAGHGHQQHPKREWHPRLTL
jgi:hypothetical protein